MRKLNSKNKLLILGLSIFTFLVLSAMCVFIIFKIKDYNAAKTAVPTIEQAKKIFGDANVSTETTSTTPAVCTLK